MRYTVEVEGQEREIDVQITPGGSVSVALDGAEVDVDAKRIPGGVSLLIGGKVYDVLVGGPAGVMQLAAGLHRVTASVLSERSRTRAKHKGNATSSKELRAPMPGKIVQVLVAVGDDVEPEQTLVVIEAMKMENELRAQAAAKVAAVEVAADQNVEGNAVLIRFE